jgi:hypothetical protein
MKSNDEMNGREKMKLTIGILGIAMALSCGGGRAVAQTDGPSPKVSETKIETAPSCYRLTYTITESDGEKRIGTQHFALTVDANTGDSQFKLGSKVPIITGSSNSENRAQTQVQYQDVGLNISARVKDYLTGVEVHSKVEQSSVSEDQSTVGRNDPIIRQAVLQNTALLTLGKPVMLGSLDVPGSTRHLDIEVVLEAVR